jgi:hypothetical protein
MDNKPQQSGRSNYEQIYSAYLGYLGIPNMENITKAQIDAIKEEGESTWYERITNANERQMVSYHNKQSQWFEGERFILFPEIFKKQIKNYLAVELPEIVATYVRGQFVGNTDRITMVKIKEVYATMMEENPNWWHSNNRKKIFFERFKSVYPRCCDGVKPVGQSNSASIPRSSIAHATQRPKAKRKSKKEKLDFHSCLGIGRFHLLIKHAF